MKIQNLTIDDVVNLPRVANYAPNKFSFSPDGIITFLYSKDKNLVHQLFAFDIENISNSGYFGGKVIVFPPNDLDEENLSFEEQLKRERQRTVQLGITDYSWANDQNRLLITINGAIYLQEDIDGALKKVIDNNDYPALDACLSPDGNWIAFVKDKELYISSVDGKIKQLTHGARENGLIHGLAEYIAQEEMGRSQGFWWSPDSRFIAFTQVDERHIPTFSLMHQGKNPVQSEEHRYPFAGQANATVGLGIISRDGGEPVWLDLGDAEYVARVDWMNGLVVQLQNREQTKLELWHFDLDGKKKILHTEINRTWINLHDMFKPLKNGFIWASEKTGFRHLYLHDDNGNEINAITEGNWMVEKVVGIDEAKGIVYFIATKETPLELHLYGASLSGGESWKITKEIGIHSIVFDKNCTKFVDIHQNLEKPINAKVYSAEGELLGTIFDETDPNAKKFNLKPPEIVEIPSDGDILYGAIYKPEGNGPFPTIVNVYGGPHVQMVSNNWSMTTNLFAQYLSQQGFLVFMLDNRGSSRRGLSFEGKIKNNLGDIEVQDQVAGVNWLIKQGLADSSKVGIFGGSYGGYMSAMCLLRAPETFKAAVAMSSVTHWDGYDTHYTERYMETPQSNPKGYEISSLMHHVQNLQGNLLLIHGMLDENVHFRHTARLIEALTEANKPYDLLVLPSERHSTRKKDAKIYVHQHIFQYFQRNLT